MNLKISVIITSWKEPNSIAKAISQVCNNSIPLFEIIQISPDDETLSAGKNASSELKIEDKFISLKDPHKGKPYALQMAINHAKGDILVLTDGDVYLKENAIDYLIKPFTDKTIGIVNGQPLSIDDRDTMFGYFGHLLAASAHHRRLKSATIIHDDFYIFKEKVFPVSGYIYAIRKDKFKIPSETPVEDAYLTYLYHANGWKMAYTPNAIVYIKYPKTIEDMVKQKRRTLKGHKELFQYKELKLIKEDRSFIKELGYFWFPFSFANNIKEVIWSAMLFPIRLYVWFRIFLITVLKGKIMGEHGWQRIESTK